MYHHSLFTDARYEYFSLLYRRDNRAANTSTSPENHLRNWLFVGRAEKQRLDKVKPIDEVFHVDLTEGFFSFFLLSNVTTVCTTTNTRVPLRRMWTYREQCIYRARLKLDLSLNGHLTCKRYTFVMHTAGGWPRSVGRRPSVAPAGPRCRYYVYTMYPCNLTWSTVLVLGLESMVDSQILRRCVEGANNFRSAKQ